MLEQRNDRLRAADVNGLARDLGLSQATLYRLPVIGEIALSKRLCRSQAGDRAGFGSSTDKSR
jgi:hypothetical protein